MIVVTAATGQLGRLVVAGLKEKVPTDQILAAVRSPEKAADLGVPVRKADYNDPASLTAALEGTDKVLLISGSEVGSRVPQHGAVVEAARKAGVSQLVYTSAPKADTSPLIVAPEHKATEEIILDSGLPYTILRNGWYNENYEAAIQQAVKTGTFVGSAGEGRTASAARADYAEAAVAVLTTDGHLGKIYEVSGDTAWTRAELAATIAEVTGKPITYRDLTPEEHKAALRRAGLDEGTAGFVAALDGDTKNGLLGDTSGELAKLIGRPTTPIKDYVTEVVSAL